MPDLRFHLNLTKRISSAFSVVATLFLPTVLVMNIAVTASVAQTVILKTVSPARVQIAKTMILKQIRVKLTSGVEIHNRVLLIKHDKFLPGNTSSMWIY